MKQILFFAMLSLLLGCASEQAGIKPLTIEIVDFSAKWHKPYSHRYRPDIEFFLKNTGTRGYKCVETRVVVIDSKDRIIYDRSFTIYEIDSGITKGPVKVNDVCFGIAPDTYAKIHFGNVKNYQYKVYFNKDDGTPWEKDWKLVKEGVMELDK